MVGNAPMDHDIVAIWLRKDRVRWIAGAMAGIFASCMMLVFTMALAALSGRDLWFAAKLPAIIVLGGQAMEYGWNTKSVLTGVVLLDLLCAFLGILYAHFTGTNHKGALLGVGLTWGLFSWIFINNLFSKSFREILTADVPAGAAFFSCLVFGLSLISVSFFDRLIRGRSTQ